ncbi:RING finger protein 214 [Gastrophryne carolinensis]
MLETHSPVGGDPTSPHSEYLTKCISVQTEYIKQDAETITDGDTEEILKQLVNRREQLKNSYQKVLDRQTQAEKQLQVQIKQLKQKRDEEIHRHKENLKSVQDLTIKREDFRKKLEKEGKELTQKEQDLGSELEKLQRKSESLQQEVEERERMIVQLLAEQTTEKEEWAAELTSLKKKDNEATQAALKELERAKNTEVLSLESRRDILITSLQEAEKEAEVTLSYLRVAPPHKEWIQLKEKWEVRLAGIQQMKSNLQEQFSLQINQVRSGTKLSELPTVSSPKLPPPPSDPNVMLQRVALGPLQMPVPLPNSLPPRNPSFQHPIGPSAFPHQRPPLLPFPAGNFLGLGQPAPRWTNVSQPQVQSEVPAPPNTEKSSKILEKLQTRFPQCNKGQLTDILHQIKLKRGTLSGLTVEELCQLVATQLQEQLTKEPPNPAIKVTQPIGHGRPQYQNTQRAQQSLPPGNGAFGVRPQLCLICQQIVKPHDLQAMSCTHVMHQECIRFWAMTNKNSSCPFCPNQR